MPFRFGPMEIGLILVIVLIVFGVGKLPQIGGAIGKGIHEFRKESRGDVEAWPPASKSPAAARSRHQSKGWCLVAGT